MDDGDLIGQAVLGTVLTALIGYIAGKTDEVVSWIVGMVFPPADMNEEAPLYEAGDE